MSIHSIHHMQLGFPAGQQSLVRHFYGELLEFLEPDPSEVSSA